MVVGRGEIWAVGSVFQHLLTQMVNGSNILASRVWACIVMQQLYLVRQLASAFGANCWILIVVQQITLSCTVVRTLLFQVFFQCRPFWVQKHLHYLSRGRLSLEFILRLRSRVFPLHNLPLGIWLIVMDPRCISFDFSVQKYFSCIL